MTKILDPANVAAGFRDEIRAQVAALPEPLTLLGLLSNEKGPSATYAEYTRRGCESVGVRFELALLPRLEVEPRLRAANIDPQIHGVLIYYPVFGTEQDAYLRDLVAPGKDVEGLHETWARRLYENRRFVDDAHTKKAILPCTPLAILKLLGAAHEGASLAGKRACIFNRSEVVGRPLASMLSNDGVQVTSFDVDGPLAFEPRGATGHQVRETSITRAEALASADIVITGVPSREFPLVQAHEIKAGAVLLNFSTLKNFDESAIEKAAVFVPRVGPMTVMMALRNTLRLYESGLSRGAQLL
ncbi:MAG: bifunctional methylenetetrahydrofolate dehydrogenase/methenyltetrahydrofolate cyclohydrolase [Polyangiaceae bacterium]